MITLLRGRFHSQEADDFALAASLPPTEFVQSRHARARPLDRQPESGPAPCYQGLPLAYLAIIDNALSVLQTRSVPPTEVLPKKGARLCYSAIAPTPLHIPTRRDRARLTLPRGDLGPVSLPLSPSRTLAVTMGDHADDLSPQLENLSLASPKHGIEDTDIPVGKPPRGPAGPDFPNLGWPL